MVTHPSDMHDPVQGSVLTHAEVWVDGMTCGSCAARVQRAVGKLPGVSTAGVNFATGRASVDYVAAITGPEAIEAAITRSGYTPRPAVVEESETARRASETERDQSESREQRSWLVRTSVAWPLGLATMGLALFVPGATRTRCFGGSSWRWRLRQQAGSCRHRRSCVDSAH